MKYLLCNKLSPLTQLDSLHNNRIRYMWMKKDVNISAYSKYLCNWMNIYVIISKLIRNNAMHIFIIALNISFTANICCYIILSCLLVLYSTPYMLVYTSLKTRSRDWKRSINGALQYSPCLETESPRLLLYHFPV